MTKLQRVKHMISNASSGILLAASFAAAALAQTMPARAAASEFDGSWSVVVLTTSGPCDPSYRFSGQIIGGAISYAYNTLEVTGHVEASGATFVKVIYGDAHAEAHGRLTAIRGSGTWSGSGPNGHCAGTWAATRESQ
jgi:hypothetical protein